MNIHQNARLTPHGRERLARIIRGGQTPQAASEAVGVCPRTGRKRSARREQEVLAGLQDRNSRPGRLREPTPPEVVERIATLRRQHLPGEESAAIVGVSPATVSRGLRRLGLNKLSALEQAGPPRRYEREQPGKMILIDIKKLGKFNQIGHRISGGRKGRSNRRGDGWKFLHVCIDYSSRVAFSTIMKTERKACAVAFLKAAVAFYRSLGITIERVMTDNGSCYKSCDFAKAAGSWPSDTSAPGPALRASTARPSASSRPRCDNGPMLAPIRTQNSVPSNCPSSCIATIGIDLMPGSDECRRSPDSA